MKIINFNYLLVLIAGLALGVSSCEKTETGGTFVIGESFDLGFDEEKTSTDGVITILFNQEVVDSRCPMNVACVWEGQAEVTLHITMPDTEPENILLIHRAGHEHLRRDTFNNHIYILEEVYPYPEEPGEIDEEDYSLQLKVEEL